MNSGATFRCTSADNWLAQLGRMALEPHLVGGVACYVVSVVVWIIGLSRVPVSIAYPMLSLGYIAAAVGAWYFLGEAISLQRMVALGIIVAGVALMAKS